MKYEEKTIVLLKFKKINFLVFKTRTIFWFVIKKQYLEFFIVQFYLKRKTEKKVAKKEGKNEYVKKII